MLFSVYRMFFDIGQQLRQELLYTPLKIPDALRHDEKGSVSLCSLGKGLLDRQINDALNQCSSNTSDPMEPISGLR